MTAAVKRDIDGNEIWWLNEGPGAHPQEPVDSEAVIASLAGRFRFVEESESKAGLRRPQLGALHAILAYRSTEEHEPITVVMPTGTGKTETMLAAYCHSPVPTLVVVPSDALRTQIAEKFVTLGVLPTLEAVVGDFLCPAVLVLKSGLQTVAQVEQLLGRSNVVVATALALNACSVEARSHLTDSCRRLFVDEAHHVEARTWREVVDLFTGREVVQFTATPYREDGRHLGGSIAYDCVQSGIGTARHMRLSHDKSSSVDACGTRSSRDSFTQAANFVGAAVGRPRGVLRLVGHQPSRQGPPG